MAFIPYRPLDAIPEEDRVGDDDNILRIHSVHPKAMRRHYDLYVELMHRSGPVRRVQREMIAVAVSAANHCRY